VCYRKLRNRPYDMNPSGAAILVTGASRGLGKALVDLLISKGCFVYATATNLELLEANFGNNPNVKVIKMDVLKQQDIDEAVEVVRKEGRGLYGIVCNSGVNTSPKSTPGVILGSIERDVDDEVLPIIRVNLEGVMRVDHSFFPFLLETRGVIVHVSSVSGKLVNVFNAAYAASKWAVEGYTVVLRNELRHVGIRVLAVAPGFFPTDMTTRIMKNDENSVDFSKTKLNANVLKKIYARHHQIAKSSTWTSEQVASDIAKCLFTSSIVNDVPHMISDSSIKKLGYYLMSFTPYYIQDWVFTLVYG